MANSTRELLVDPCRTENRKFPLAKGTSICDDTLLFLVSALKHALKGFLEEALLVAKLSDNANLSLGLTSSTLHHNRIIAVSCKVI